MEPYHKKNFQVRHGQWGSIIFSDTFSEEAISNYQTFSVGDERTLLTRPEISPQILL